MHYETTSVLGIMTGKIKNNPSIYASKYGFNIFLNGELIISNTDLFQVRSSFENLKKAKQILEDLKAGTYKNKKIQERFDSFIRN